MKKSCKNKLYTFLSVCIAVLLLGCEIPFFVNKVEPQTDSNLSTPDNVLKQLKRAYENRRIDLFEDLLYSKEEFRFYIENNQLYVDTALQHINKNQYEKAIIDKDVDFVVADDSTYVYLTYGEEVNIHRNMFRKTDQIVFGTFDIYQIDYFSIPVSSGDSVNYDTLEAILYLDETDITMTSDMFSPIYGNRSVKFQVAKQVFFMKKDSKDFWRIRLWFELGRKRTA